MHGRAMERMPRSCFRPFFTPLPENSPLMVYPGAGAGTLRAAALDHEAGDDPVEGEAIIKTRLHQADKLFTEMGATSG